MNCQGRKTVETKNNGRGRKLSGQGRGTKTLNSTCFIRPGPTMSKIRDQVDHDMYTIINII